MSSVMLGTKDYIVRITKNYIESGEFVMSPKEFCDGIFIFAYMSGRFPNIEFGIVYDAVQELRGMYFKSDK